MERMVKEMKFQEKKIYIYIFHPRDDLGVQERQRKE